MPHNFIYLFDYFDWNEEEVNGTLHSEYGWETATDTATTWRVGDGTAAFYNYVYFSVAGFTEHDVLRSNMIRAGKLTREKAIALVQEENKLRWESISEYAHTVGIKVADIFDAVEKMPKLYSNK